MKGPREQASGLKGQATRHHDAKATTDTDRRLGERLRVYRQLAGLSQTALATKLGVTFQQVQKYEKGVNRLSAGRLEQSAKALGISPATLLGCEESLDQSASFFPSHYDANTKRLVTAFERISDPDVRRALVKLTEAAAVHLPSSEE